ncbi:hypothetical protein [Spirosoma montaniterrae]|uniref:DUF4595 domain-containing protein n=1 Tax=Spirosoma montaniterrae TaxID=1178516 RepID=A0A1P9WZ68_9BACT|nr:hypothetical protein [Spirosoma montaniterrae]AQG80618.1 hypothetical protein AWR27_15575 [Spirosoma montaniterrae]
MKSVCVYNLFVVALLMGCGGCQKTTDPVAGPAVSDSVRVARQTIKELISPSQPSRLEEETVVVEGQSYRVGMVQQSSYSYDKQGRILSEYNQYFGASSMTERTDSIYYEYVGSAVNIRRVALNTVPKRVTTQRLALDSRGFAEEQGYTKVTYNDEGYVISRKGEYLTYSVNNGNETEILMEDHDGGPSHTIKNEFDLTKSGLVPIKTFFGKISRNLLVGYTIQQNGPFRTYPNVYVGRYSYEFDKNDLVTTEIFNGKTGEPPYLWGGNKLTVKRLVYTGI